MELLSNIWFTYIVNILDILIVAYIFYRTLLVIKGTRTIQVVIGLIVLVAITIVARDVLHLQTLSWLMSKFWVAAVVILAVVFQTEIRYGLAKLGSKLFFTETNVKSNFLEEIVEAADGVVVFSGWQSGYGNVIAIEHGRKYRTVYAHLSKSLVKKGELVTKGQEIAKMGSTGRSTGPHVHYELHLNKRPINPMKYLTSYLD